MYVGGKRFEERKRRGNETAPSKLDLLQLFLCGLLTGAASSQAAYGQMLGSLVCDGLERNQMIVAY
jgi:hypothetical protein